MNKCLPIHHRFRRTLLATGAASVLVLAGCGSDDSASDATTADAPADAPADTTAATTAETVAETVGDTSADSGSGDGDVQAVCDNLIELDQTVPTGQATKEEANATLDEAIAAADEETATMLTTFKDTLQPVLDDPEAEPSDAFFEQVSGMLGWVGENCDVETIDAIAAEYKFTGVPEELAAGYYILNFTNDGNEMHELGAVRINDDVTLSVEELLALPEEESDSMVEFLSGAFAAPGDTSVASLNLVEPGRYTIACFVPTGTTMDAEGTGPPHAMQGMFQEITVT